MVGSHHPFFNFFFGRKKAWYLEAVMWLTVIDWYTIQTTEELNATSKMLKV